MTNFDRDIQRKLRALRHAEQIGDVSKAFQVFPLRVVLDGQAVVRQRGIVELDNWFDMASGSPACS